MEIAGLSGAGVMLLSNGRPQASLCSSDEVSRMIEELQYTLGEGPCVDAHRDGRVISEPDLAGAGSSRWPGFTQPAVDAGAKAVFGFPIRLGSVRLGALNLYRNAPGPLHDDEYADALVLSDVAARTILEAQAAAGPDQLGAGLEADTYLWRTVNQAAGMVSIQLDISIAEALDRLRARAYATDRMITAVARDVVERRLRFDTGAGSGGW